MLKENKKTKLELKLEKQKKLIEEADKLKSEIKQLTAKQAKVEREEERRRKNRIKLHAGGMCEMTGLLNYVYNDPVARDNEQDELIANLIVWAAAGFMDTLLRCEDETGGGLCGRDGNSVVSSSWKR